jgi:tetrahydromethanopterin S-methyltransferase subunit E
LQIHHLKRSPAFWVLFSWDVNISRPVYKEKMDAFSMRLVRAVSALATICGASGDIDSDIGSQSNQLVGEAQAPYAIAIGGILIIFMNINNFYLEVSTRRSTGRIQATRKIYLTKAEFTGRAQLSMT